MVTNAQNLFRTEDELRQEPFQKSIQEYRKVFTSMAKNLKESQYEHYLLGTEKEYHLETKIVNCMQRLAQNAGGLRSAATTQFLLLSQPTIVANQSYSSSKMLRKRVSSYISFDGAPSSGTRTPTRTISTVQETRDEQTVNHGQVVSSHDDWLVDF